MDGLRNCFGYCVCTRGCRRGVFTVVCETGVENFISGPFLDVDFAGAGELLFSLITCTKWHLVYVAQWGKQRDLS